MSSEPGVLKRVEESTRREMEEEEGLGTDSIPEDSKGTKGMLVVIQGAYDGIEVEKENENGKLGNYPHTFQQKEMKFH